MSEYNYITLGEKTELKDRAADWFHSKWGVPMEACLTWWWKTCDQRG